MDQREVVLASLLVLAGACGGSGAAGPSDAGAAATDASIGHDAASDDGESSIDAAPTDGTTTSEAAAPIVAAADTWTWVEFPESKCASGRRPGSP
jgi:hypothetical protein